MFELSDTKPNENKTAASFEVVINNIHMQDLISDDVLNDMNDKIELIKSRTKMQHNLFKELQQEVKTINFDTLFKDPALLKNIRKIMKGTMKTDVNIKAAGDANPSKTDNDDKSQLKVDRTIITGIESQKSSSS